MNEWIEKARKYAIEHPSVKHVSEQFETKEGICFYAIFKINLPGKYDLIGESPNGIKENEVVTFIFSPNFPFRAPNIYLRDDFPRNFPHINPSLDKVIPCIFDGSLDQLLQQPKWFDQILDQLVEWLEKASSDCLMDYAQGWEPMRIDNTDGIIIFPKEPLLNHILREKKYVDTRIIRYIESDNIIYGKVTGDDPDLLIDKDASLYLLFSPQKKQIVSEYFTKAIKNLDDLHNLTLRYGIKDLLGVLNNIIKNLSKEFLFVSFIINRPVKLINDTTNYEFLNFAIKVKRTRKKRINLNSDVFVLQHYDESNTELLKRFSGIDLNPPLRIIGIGCGSLGSKIIMHLARNGACTFDLYDNSFFHPHNNARHALVGFSPFKYKSKMLSDYCLAIGVYAKSNNKDIRTINLEGSDADVIIDSTADLSVLQYLNSNKNTPPIINTSLYNNGKTPIMLIEGREKNPDIDSLMAFVYSKCLENTYLRDSIFSNKAVLTSIGQGCGSYTTICQDAIISISAASISLKIQKILSSGLKKSGLIHIGKILDDEVSWNNFDCAPLIELKNETNQIHARLFQSVKERMDNLSKNCSPKETGGVLIGHISNITNSIIITDLIDAPVDSRTEISYFELGFEGLKMKVDSIERKTNSMLTYVGTWHSHPTGGAPSSIDIQTKKNLLSLRDHEPTVCLIWTPSEIIQF